MRLSRDCAYYELCARVLKASVSLKKPTRASGEREISMILLTERTRCRCPGAICREVKEEEEEGSNQMLASIDRSVLANVYDNTHGGRLFPFVPPARLNAYTLVCAHSCFHMSPRRKFDDDSLIPRTGTCVNERARLRAHDDARTHGERANAFTSTTNNDMVIRER